MVSNFIDYDYELKSIHEVEVVTHAHVEQKWRVKLYGLNPDGQWDDRGTGNIFISKFV